jgi:hypothetical protein
MAATAVEELYRQDFYAWTRDQARRLRELRETRPNLPLDLEHLAEEVEGLGLSDLRGVRSHVRRIIEHLLKLEYSPAAEPREGWRGSIIDSRTDVGDVLTRTLRNDLEAEFGSLYAPARKKAASGLRGHGEEDAVRALPAECPYTLDDVLREDWYPPNRHGIVDPE